MRIVAILAGVAAVVWLLLKSTSGISGSVGGDPQQTPSESGYSGGIDNIMQAIANFEGNGARYNNPGNIKSTKSAYDGQVGTAPGGYAIFGDMGDGWTRLQAYIASHTAAHPDWDFYDFFSNYLNGSTTAPTQTAQGNSDNYAEYVANYIGVDPTTPVSQVM
jgi:hypothetical protein